MKMWAVWLQQFLLLCTLACANEDTQRLRNIVQRQRRANTIDSCRNEKSKISTFTGFVSVVFEITRDRNITNRELEMIGGVFRDSYNAFLQENHCDPAFRQIESVNATIEERITIPRGSTVARLLLEVNGTCVEGESCDGISTNLFAGANRTIPTLPELPEPLPPIPELPPMLELPPAPPLLDLPPTSSPHLSPAPHPPPPQLTESPSLQKSLPPLPQLPPKSGFQKATSPPLPSPSKRTRGLRKTTYSIPRTLAAVAGGDRNGRVGTNKNSTFACGCKSLRYGISKVEDFLLQAFEPAMMDLIANNIDLSITKVLEVHEIFAVPCLGEITEWEATVTMEVESSENISSQEIVVVGDDLGQVMKEGYNSAQAENCDLEFRFVESVSLTISSSTPTAVRKLTTGEKRRNTQQLSYFLVFEYLVRGECRGCILGSGIFDDASKRRHLQQGGGGNTSNKGDDGNERNNDNSGNDDKQYPSCFCPTKGKAFRPPRPGEIKSTLNSYVTGILKDDRITVKSLSQQRDRGQPSFTSSSQIQSQIPAP